MKRLYIILLGLIVLLNARAQEVLNSDGAVSDSVILVSSLPLPEEDKAQTEVVYDPLTGNYVMHTKVGGVDITTPYMLTPTEYASYHQKQVMHTYWQSKINEVDHSNESKFDITDMKFDIGPADKIFGPGGVQLKLQGSAELLFGFKHQFVDNPSLTQRGKNNNIFDFDEKIQASVNAKVGDKLSFNLNYNTEASFDFDQQNLKLQYKGKEDDIIQSIEAGNVSMDLNSSLIRSTQALFGVKANLQFGKLKVQGLISQQNSESQSVSSEGGAQTTKFEKNIDEYDENRHFFLSYYFRDRFEQSMASLPYIASGVTINKVEVWITNKRGTFDEARNIIAFADLGESNQHLMNVSWGGSGSSLPANETNSLYQTMVGTAGLRDLANTSAILDGNYSMMGGESYDRIESARRLNSSEYTLNSALGFISLNTTLNPDEVLAVAFEYSYNGQVYQVGEFSTDNGGDAKAPNALFLKLLKGTNTTPIAGKKGRGTWDLMMKNIYSLGASSITSDKFELNIMYRNDSIGTEMQYINEGNIRGKQLLRVFNLDRLDSRHNPSPDGKFDYVEGFTVLSSSGRIIFPVLEPFGNHLAAQLGNNPTLTNKYCFQELYDSTLVVAQENSEKNKFTLTGKYKGSSGSEIRLNAMNVPRGSVIVTAGGATLIENVDYTVDYTMGIVTILNQAILDSGTKVDVQMENQSTFSLQQKNLYGLHLEYDFTKDLMIGGTLMHLRERPLTTKVATGNEPLANTIWGLNFAWKTDLQWLTNALNSIPWIEATQPSTFQINGEFAQLVPSHTKDVGASGTAYIDDFESTINGIDIHYPNQWFLASTPNDPSSRLVFAKNEGGLKNNISYNRHRAHLAWYAVDPIFGYSQPNTPQHIKEDKEAMSDHRSRIVYERELYPTKQSPASEDTRLSCLSLAYYPQERGAYNISADMIGPDGKIPALEAVNCWGGIMRKLDNTDFEKSNVEYIEFWLMDPALTNPDNPDNYDCELYFDLGDISEDILKDGKKSFEHGLPVNPEDTSRVTKTIWGYVPKTNATVNSFDNDPASRRSQDVGLNGLSSANTRSFEYNGSKPYEEYYNQLKATVGENSQVWRDWLSDPFSPINDLAGDKYHYYRGTDYDEAGVSIMDRYKRFNGTNGNSPSTEDQTERYGTASTLMPDVEDINKDNTLNEYERYYEYHVSIRPSDMRIGSQNIVSIKTARVQLANGREDSVRWYQFKIPLHGTDASVHKVGNIRNFRSIRFMRMYITGTSNETFLRFGTLDLVRGEWRSYTKDLAPVGQAVNPSAVLSMESVNIEEDATREPVNYILPPGVSRQTDPGQMQLIAQNEQSMVLKVMELSPKDARAVYKNTVYDMRNYKRLQMFVHAEALKTDVGEDRLQDGDFSCFIRVGTDLSNNYYEYEIPLKVTAPGRYNNDNVSDRRIVWPDDNMIDFPFELFTAAKLARNRAHEDLHVPYIVFDKDKPQNTITVKGNPTLEEVSAIMIGIRNSGTQQKNGEVWVNELRLNTFDERGGVAAMANASLAVSDIAQVNVSGKLETAGYGSIESNVLNRNMENFYDLSVSAAMEVGRLFPAKAKIQLPAYVSYSKQTTTPDYNPFDSDVKMSDALDNLESKEEKDSLKSISNTVVESTSFSVTNAKINIHSKKRDMFYDPANFSVSASYNKQEDYSPEVKSNTTTDHKGSFTYSYNFNPKPWEPFAKVDKVQKIRFLKEFNIYYLPQSWAFSTNMHRTFSNLKMRELTSEVSAREMDITASKDFTWDRHVDINYNLTKNMKFTFQSAYNGTIDEGIYSKEIIRDREYAWKFTNDDYAAWKDTIQRSLAKWGSPYTYQQVFTANWNVPFNRIPYLEALTANASYNGSYNWTRTAPTTSGSVDLGNSVSSSRSWQVDGGLNLETLYGKSKYWKDMTQFYTGRARNRTFRPKNFTQTYKAVKGEVIEVNHRLNSKKIVVTAADSAGKHIPIKYVAKDDNTLAVTPHANSDNLIITITTQDPNKKSGAEIAGNMFAYVGTMIRRIQVTYRETASITAPGFYPQAGFMGQDVHAAGGSAPGFDFAFGFFPNDWINKATRKGWITGNDSVVQPMTRANTSDFDIKLTLEPLPGLKIQVNGKRYFANTSTITMTGGEQIENLNGSFNITSVGLATMFSKIGNEADNFSNSAFDQFLINRDILQNRVQNQYRDVILPRQGFMRDMPNDQKYQPGVNGLPVPKNSADVLVPAFLAAYTGRDASTMNLNPFLGILKILPNWSVTYDGLSKLPGIKEHFRSFSLTHAYVCKYSIGSYGSYSTWVGPNGTQDKQLGFIKDVTSGMPIPSSSYDITNVSLSESFSPLIGLNMSLKNSLNCKFEYRKQRNLAMNITSVQITEGHTDEFVIGAGYTVKNLNFVAKNRDGGQKKVSNDLKLNVDVSYKNIKTLLRKVEENLTQASSGNKMFTIKVSADYVLSQKISLQLFYDHEGTMPLISSSYPVKADNVGLNIKLMLTR